MLEVANINKKNLSPLYKVKNKLISEYDIQLWIKRDDLLHPQVSGNKWRKLKYNLVEAKQKKVSHLLTFGGAFSNHIAATAAASHLVDIPSIGIIRGERVLPLNPTLAFAENCGMNLYFLTRTTYRQKENAPQVQQLLQQYPSSLVLPEGGTNHLAIKGCEEIVTELRTQFTNNFPNYICTAVGTGGTISGLISGLQQLKKVNTQVVGFSALKGNFLEAEVRNLLSNYDKKNYTNWQIESNYHFGGYAKFKPELIAFINHFKTEQGISLDPIYTGKMMFGIFDLVKKGFFPKGSHIVAIHTGGLQGIAGFKQKFGNILI